MAVLQALAFVAIGVVLLLITLVALFRIAALRVESSLGRTRDGLARGDIAPAWRLSDRDGVPHQVPSSVGWQALVFVNQWIVAFPSLARELGRIQLEFPDVEVLVVTKADPDVAAIGLSEVVTG